MGIPLAALAVNPPQQPPNVLENAQRALQLKGLLQAQPLQQQALQQSIQAGALENQQRQQQLTDQQAQTAALKAWDGKDVHDLPGLLLKNGGSAQAVFSMKNQLIAQQKNLAEADEFTLKNQQTKNDLIAGHLEAVKSAPPDQKQQAFDSALTDLEQKGFLKPGQIPHQYPGDGQLSLVEKGFQGGKQLVDQAMKEREVKAQELTAQSRSDTAATSKERLAAELPGGALQPVEKQEMNDYLAKHPGKGPADFAAFKARLAPQAQISVQGGIVGPEGDTLANAVANGSMKIQDVLTPRTPLPIRQQFLSKVMAINPGFKSYEFDVERGVAKDFTSGKAAQNLTAFNTAIEHASQLDKATDALNNGDVRTLNSIGNALGYQFGSDKTTNFNVIKNALSGEVSKVFKGGQATDAEIKAVQAPFDAANSPAQLKGAIKTAIALMNSKRDALRQQYEAGRSGQPNFGTNQPSFSPPAGAPAGATHTGIGSIDKKKHYLDANGKDLGVAE